MSNGLHLDKAAALDLLLWCHSNWQTPCHAQCSVKSYLYVTNVRFLFQRILH